MIKKENIRFIMLSLLFSTLSACGGGSSGGGVPSQVSCSIPCLDSTPLIDTSSVSSATGGTVKVTFTLRGDITNVNNVVVFLAPTDILSGNPSAGSGTLMAPTQATNTIDIVVAAGSTVATGSYYPWITITPNSPTNSGGEYYIDPTSSSSMYTYTEIVGGGTPTPTLTSFTIPTLQVVP